MKHGFGVESLRNGLLYEGNWEFDMKHGDGKMTFPDNRVITTTWELNRMHGPGISQDATGKRSEATYYYDLEIKLADQNPDCYNHFWANLLLVAISVGFFYGYS